MVSTSVRPRPREALLPSWKDSADSRPPWRAMANPSHITPTDISPSCEPMESNAVANATVPPNGHGPLSLLSAAAASLNAWEVEIKKPSGPQKVKAKYSGDNNDDDEEWTGPEPTKKKSRTRKASTGPRRRGGFRQDEPL